MYGKKWQWLRLIPWMKVSGSWSEVHDMEGMITDSEATEDLKGMFRRMFSGEKHFLVEIPVKGAIHRCILPLTEGDTYDVMKYNHVPVPPDMEVKCMDMDIYLDKYLSNEIADMPERKEYEEAMKEGMYIFPQEVK